MTSMSELVETNLDFLSHWAINSRYILDFLQLL